MAKKILDNSKILGILREHTKRATRLNSEGDREIYSFIYKKTSYRLTAQKISDNLIIKTYPTNNPTLQTISTRNTWYYIQRTLKHHDINLHRD